MLLANTSLLRAVNVHQDPGVMGKWHEHGLFSVGYIYGFPLTCVQASSRTHLVELASAVGRATDTQRVPQWDASGGVVQNGTASRCDQPPSLTVTFLLPVWMHRILDKGCMGQHLAPNCPNEKAPERCGGFFFRLELLAAQPRWAD